MLKLLLINVVLFCVLICLRRYTYKQRVALLLSGETRSFKQLQTHISSYINNIEKTNNAIVDVYLCLSEQIDFKITIPDVCGIRYDTTNIQKDEHYTHQMNRWNLCYESIPNKHRYNWFIRSRPDIKLLNYKISLNTLNKNRMHVRYRLSKDEDLDPNKCSWWTSAKKCIKSNVNVVDDQFFVVHSKLADKVFSITRDDNYITRRDGNGKMQEDIFNEMLMSHGIETEPLSIETKLIR